MDQKKPGFLENWGFVEDRDFQNNVNEKDGFCRKMGFVDVFFKKP